MTDILIGDDAKLKVRLFAYFLQKELTKMGKEHGMVIPEGKGFIDVVHGDLQNSSNPSVRKMYRKLLEGGGYMIEQHQTAIVKDLGASFLWFIIKDTAYRDLFFWYLNELYSDPEFMKHVAPLVKKPEDWYCYNWNISKKITAEKHASGELPDYELSEAEKVYVPGIQEENWRRTREDIEKQFKQHKR